MLVQLRQVGVPQQVEVLRGVVQELPGQPLIQLVLAGGTQTYALEKIGGTIKTRNNLNN